MLSFVHSDVFAGARGRGSSQGDRAVVRSLRGSRGFSERGNRRCPNRREPFRGNSVVRFNTKTGRGATVEALAATLQSSAKQMNRASDMDKAKWTYFGDAFFNVALRQAKSLKDALLLARSLVLKRELRQGFDPSHPQMAGGGNVEALLAAQRARSADGAAAGLSNGARINQGTPPVLSRKRHKKRHTALHSHGGSAARVQFNAGF